MINNDIDDKVEEEAEEKEIVGRSYVFVFCYHAFHSFYKPSTM